MAAPPSKRKIMIYLSSNYSLINVFTYFFVLECTATAAMPAKPSFISKKPTFLGATETKKEESEGKVNINFFY